MNPFLSKCILPFKKWYYKRHLEPFYDIYVENTKVATLENFGWHDMFWHFWSLSVLTTNEKHLSILFDERSWLLNPEIPLKILGRETNVEYEFSIAGMGDGWRGLDDKHVTLESRPEHLLLRGPYDVTEIGETN